MKLPCLLLLVPIMLASAAQSGENRKSIKMSGWDAGRCTAALQIQQENLAFCKNGVGRANISRELKAQVYLALGYTYYFVDEPKGPDAVAAGKAFQMWKTASKLNPKSAAANVAMGDVMLGGGHKSEALAYFDQAIEDSPGDWRGSMAKAIMVYSQCACEAGLALAKKASELGKSDPLATQRYGLMLEMAQKNEDALAQYDSVLKNFDPNNPRTFGKSALEDPRVAAARVSFRLQRFQESVRRYHEYFDRLPAAQRTQEAYSNLAVYEENAGNFAAAASAYEKAEILPGREKSENLRLDRFLALAKSGLTGSARSGLFDILSGGTLHQRLHLQVFLRNNGYKDVVIDGQNNESTRKALGECLDDNGCANSLGWRI